ncbi:MAG: phage tail protein [Pseudonocardiaceae bacterium]
MNEENPAYWLLPAVHRIRDVEHGYPLRSLLGIVEEELRRLEEDVDGLYDNWFIETCDEWVVPYLGDLLGVQGLAPLPGTGATQRAVVANTLRYRRRKGTAAVLEQLARDVTGWPARVVEYFQLLGTTQHLEHVRPANLHTPDLRDASRLELLETPFGTATRTAEVRHIDVRRGRHNIPNIGLHLWRLAAYAVAGTDARPLEAALGRWTFDPAGRDVPLFNRPRTETEVTHLAEEVNVPGPLRRRALHEELATPPARPPVFLAEPLPALRVRLGSSADPARLICCDLTDWQRPATEPGDPTVAVDPVLGRLTLPDDVVPGRVRVDYAYGFSGDLGAGPYDRRVTLGLALEAVGLLKQGGVDWQVGVGRDVDPVPGKIVRTLGEAIALWNARSSMKPGQVGVIAVLDSATYREDLSIVIPPDNRLLLVAATWPAREDPDQPGGQVREPGSFAAGGLRPHLIGSIEVSSPPVGPEGASSGFVLDGFSVEGSLHARPGGLGDLVLAGCSLLTDRDATLADGGWVLAEGNPQLIVRMMRSVCSGVRLANEPGLGLTDCIVHADGRTDVAAIEATAAHVEVEACTVLGATVVRSLAASNSILRGVVKATRRQQGCVRFCYLPWESQSPRRYRCHPRDEVASRTVAPRFTSVRPVDPGFGQLAPDCPAEIVTGADDEGEMGAFHFLQQHRRVTNLISQLDQYLRFGLEAGVFFAT